MGLMQMLSTKHLHYLTFLHISQVAVAKSEEVKVRQDNVSKLLTDVQIMKGKQESMDGRLLAMKHENESLWREVASLRQKHSQQQKVVNKLIQFLISLVQSNRILGVKRKIPLMLSDSSTHSLPKYGRQFSLEPVHGAATYPAPLTGFTSSSLYSPDASAGPIISDVTELAQSSPSMSPSPSVEESCSPVILIKEEPLTPSDSPQTCDQSPAPPEAEDTSLSPSTFIDSILQESEPAAGPGGAKDGMDAQPCAQEPCLSVACLDNVASSRQMSEVSRLFPTSTCCSSTSLQGRMEPGNELNDHVDTIDSSLDSLHNMFNAHNFSVDTSALLDLFSPSMGMPDLSLPDLDSSLASIQELLSSQEQKSSEAEQNAADTGKQIVHYSPQPLILMDSGNSDLPIFLELQGDEPYLAEEEDYSEDPTMSLLSWDTQNKPKDPGIS
ncbi:heat shock factor protein 1 [Discoglossus pictus]